MTIQQALQQAQQQLHHLDHPLLIAQSLLAKTLGASTSYLWSHSDQIITDEQQQSWQALLDRASQHEPLAYLLGYKEFYGRRFTVTPDTLIPRPESEQIIDQVLSHHQSNTLQSQLSPPLIVDVGTGSGCLAITLALELPQATIIAIDLSSDALTVAQKNAHQLKASNITFLQGNLLDPLKTFNHQNKNRITKIDILIANLPYISDQEFPSLPDTVKNYEPSLALKSGPHPDHLNRQLIQQAFSWLTPHSLFLYETTNGKIITHHQR